MRKVFFIFMAFAGNIIAQTPIIYQDVEVQNSLKLDYLGAGSENKLLSTDANGKVVIANADAVYRVPTYTDISSLTVVDNSVILTDVGGVYYVASSGTHEDFVSIQTANSKYAILQTRNGGYYVEDFGAYNDGLDDSEAIQSCIDAALKNNVGRVNLGPGKFILEKGVIIGYQVDNPQSIYHQNFRPVSLVFSGNTPAYDGVPNSGITTIEVVDNDVATADFGIAVQFGRNCVIENINFKGDGDIFSLSPKQIIEFDDTDWENRGLRMNRYSPSCAIAIDPFKSTIGAGNRYQYHDTDDRYLSSESAGTSMMTIRGCSFMQFFIAIANNPSAGVYNGDNVKVEQCNVQRCHTFFASGQTQSRSNNIENVYSTFVKTFVDCSLIGMKSGTPPTISNCNLAGFTKELIHMEWAGFSNFRVSDTYAESLFSLGYCNAEASFHQCQFSFKIPSANDDIYQAPYHLFSTKASFDDCNIEFFANNSYPRPFVFFSSHLTFSGGQIEGGVIISGGDSKGLHGVTYENTMLKTQNSLVGRSIIRAPAMSEFNSKIMLGGEKFVTKLSKIPMKFESEESTYIVIETENVNLTVDHTAKTASFVTTEPGRYKIGDNLVQHFYVVAGAPLIDQSAAKMKSVPRLVGAIGFIQSIEEDTQNPGNFIVEIAGIPYGLVDGQRYIRTLNYPRFLPPIWGDVTSGSNIITNIDVYGSSFYPVVGRKIKIFNEAFPTGTYITAVNSTNRTITVSTEATQSLTHSYIRNSEVKQEVNWAETWPTTKRVPLIPGGKIYFKKVSPTFYGYVVTEGGHLNPFPVTPPHPEAQLGAMTY